MSGFLLVTLWITSKSLRLIVFIHQPFPSYTPSNTHFFLLIHHYPHPLTVIELFFENSELFIQLRICCFSFFDFFKSMECCGMIPASEKLSDSREGRV